MTRARRPPFSLRDEIVRREVADSPAMEPGELGLRLRAGNFFYDREVEVLVLPLFAAYVVPQSLDAALRDLARAFVVHVENVEAERAFAAGLEDRTVIPETSATPNFRRELGAWGDPDVRIGGWLGFTAEIRVPRPRSSPSLFVHATLLEHRSNVLAFDLGARSVTSYLEGNPHALRATDLPSE